MPTDTKQILKEALELPAVERASLADQLLSSLDQPDEHIDALWNNKTGTTKQGHIPFNLTSTPLSCRISTWQESHGLLQPVFPIM